VLHKTTRVAALLLPALFVVAWWPACPEGRPSAESGRLSRGSTPTEETGARQAMPANPRPGTDLPAALAGLETFYLQRLGEARVVGSSFALVQDGRVLSRINHGMADRERQRPVTDDTIYHWASITKTFTAIAIMQLRDRGRLSLDDPAVKYLPELRAVHNPFGDLSEVTIRRLMSHSAGFRSPTWPWGGDKPWHPFEPKEWSQLVAMLPYTEVEFRPGSRYNYSNPGIIFLGRIIELLTGDDYEVYVDKNIFKPLGMLRSYFDATPYHLLPHRSASYYVTKAGSLRAAPFDADTGITVSNGGLNAPIDDMVRYLDFLIGAGSQREAHEGVLKRSSLEEMFVPQVSAGTEGADRVSVGLNFFVEDRAGYRLVGHSGSQNAFILHFYVCPALRAGYVVAFNTEWEAGGGTAAETVRRVDAELRDYVLKNVFPALK
jgi:CubicO group peptidase (beta-lactamase class C family)